MRGRWQAADLEAPFGNNHIAVPYGTLDDAAHSIEATLSESPWARIGSLFLAVAGDAEPDGRQVEGTRRGLCAGLEWLR